MFFTPVDGVVKSDVVLLWLDNSLFDSVHSKMLIQDIVGRTLTFSMKFFKTYYMACLMDMFR